MPFRAIDDKTLYTETGGIPETVFDYITKHNDTLSRKLQDVIAKNRLNDYGSKTIKELPCPLPSSA